MSKKIKKNIDITDSLNVAIEGIIDSIRTERNLKFHFFCSISLIIFSIFIGINRFELMILSISIFFVIVTELVNTVIETIIDMVSPDFHPLAKRAKDIAAGAVFLSATCAIFNGYLIFSKRINYQFGDFFETLKNSYSHVMVFILIFILSLVIILKAIFKKGTPLRGGIPSGHSALAGALTVGIFFLTNDSRIFYLSLCLFILVLQSRVEGKIHTVTETIIGGFLGMGVTYVFLYFLNL